MVDAAMGCRFVRMTIKAVGRGTCCDDVDHRLRWAVVTGGTGACTVGRHVMLGALDFSPGRYDMAFTARRAVGQVSGPKSNCVTVRMAVEVVGRVTLAAIASRCGRSVRCGVVAGRTAVVLLDVRAIDEVRIIDRCGMAAVTFGLQRDLGGVILCRMRRKITCDAAMTLRTVTRCGARQLGPGVMADITVVMLDIAGRIDKGRVIDRAAMTAGTTGGLRDQHSMILSVRGPVSRDSAVACGTINRTGGDGAVRTMARGTGVMLVVIRRVDEVLTRGHRRGVAACTLAVQRDIAGRLVIDIVIRPVATRMTGRTGVRIAEPGIQGTMVHRRADQCVGAGIVTGRTAVMHLGIVRIGEGRCRIGVTDQAGRLAGHVTGTNVIHAVIDIRHLRDVTGGAGGRTAAGNRALDISQWRRCRAGIGMTAGAVA